MAKVLILGNFELALDVEEGKPVSEAQVRAKERRILRFLKKLAEDEPGEKGAVESFEFESFTTFDGTGAPSTSSYYYNKYEGAWLLRDDARLA